MMLHNKERIYSCIKKKKKKQVLLANNESLSLNAKKKSGDPI